ncbi:hypothetical protein PAPYR_3588 [Paratrimastix pyriformis]|uniref:Uncharacterized protein n=1 Tax=Paratrimastix pyriformis TaxID=342808 RepID=A0ABQ8ULZ2_9EUKA|nr:hypothetical protein PAPYR_3588 [Paratrimastix pyriformis]
MQDNLVGENINRPVDSNQAASDLGTSIPHVETSSASEAAPIASGSSSVPAEPKKSEVVAEGQATPSATDEPQHSAHPTDPAAAGVPEQHATQSPVASPAPADAASSTPVVAPVSPAPTPAPAVPTVTPPEPEPQPAAATTEPPQSVAAAPVEPTPVAAAPVEPTPAAAPTEQPQPAAPVEQQPQPAAVTPAEAAAPPPAETSEPQPSPVLPSIVISPPPPPPVRAPPQTPTRVAATPTPSTPQALAPVPSPAPISTPPQTPPHHSATPTPGTAPTPSRVSAAPPAPAASPVLTPPSSPRSEEECQAPTPSRATPQHPFGHGPAAYQRLGVNASPIPALVFPLEDAAPAAAAAAPPAAQPEAVLAPSGTPLRHLATTPAKPLSPALLGTRGPACEPSPPPTATSSASSASDGEGIPATAHVILSPEGVSSPTHVRLGSTSGPLAVSASPAGRPATSSSPTRSPAVPAAPPAAAAGASAESPARDVRRKMRDEIVRSFHTRLQEEKRMREQRKQELDNRQRDRKARLEAITHAQEAIAGIAPATRPSTGPVPKQAPRRPGRHPETRLAQQAPHHQQRPATGGWCPGSAPVPLAKEALWLRPPRAGRPAPQDARPAAARYGCRNPSALDPPTSTAGPACWHCDRVDVIVAAWWLANPVLLVFLPFLADHPAGTTRTEADPPWGLLCVGQAHPRRAVKDRSNQYIRELRIKREAQQKKARPFPIPIPLPLPALALPFQVGSRFSLWPAPQPELSPEERRARLEHLQAALGEAVLPAVAPGSACRELLCDSEAVVSVARGAPNRCVLLSDMVLVAAPSAQEEKPTVMASIPWTGSS